MKNSKINKIKKERAEKDNHKFWFKRIGKCSPKICGGACCRFKTTWNYNDGEYHDSIREFRKDDVYLTKKIGKRELVIQHIICPHMTMDCKCKLHGKKKQPYTCDVFPMHPRDGTYKAVKKFCGYSFIKIQNKKYKKIKKPKAVLDEE